MRPIDVFLPQFDVNEAHTIMVKGTPAAVYRVVRSLDFSCSPVIRNLFRLRGLSSSSIRLGRLQASGFILLADEPGQHLVLGLLGRFWQPSGQLIEVAPQAFAGAAPAGCAKAVWDFEMTDIAPDRVRLSTETRVLCLDAYSRRRFRLYWQVIGPFSAWIRREMLRAVKRQVEQNAGDSLATG